MSDQSLFQIIFPDDATVLERSYLEALQRIMDGRPTAQPLSARSSDGRFRPSRSAVAQEAGHSRTPLSGGSLPRVVGEIARAQRHYSSSSRPEEALAEIDRLAAEARTQRDLRLLRERNTVLVRQRDAAYTSAHASVMLAQALQKARRRRLPDVQEARRAAERAVLPQ